MISGARRSWRDTLVRALVTADAALVVGVTVVVIAYVLHAASAALVAIGPADLLTGPRWRPESLVFGALPLLVGTLVTSLGALLLGALPAIAAATWLSELAPPFVTTAARRVMAIAAGVPSVVYGWLALLHLLPPLERVAHAVYGADAAVAGEGIAAGTLLLALMIVPTVLLLSLDALARVPRELRDAALGVGASPWQAALRVTVPCAWRGLAIAAVLGFARAAGEAMAVQMVIGGARDLATTPFTPTTTIAAQIAVDAQNTLPGTVHASALFALALLWDPLESTCRHASLSIL